jgi:hypothetical protein
MAEIVADPHVPGALGPEPAVAADATRSHPADKGKLRVFISYSRTESDFADQLQAALQTCGFECVIDREDISGGEDWKTRLGAGRLCPFAFLGAVGDMRLGGRAVR